MNGVNIMRTAQEMMDEIASHEKRIAEIIAEENRNGYVNQRDRAMISAMMDDIEHDKEILRRLGVNY
jgi:ubiquinone biosynthesis protein UbiJ